MRWVLPTYHLAACHGKEHDAGTINSISDRHADRCLRGSPEHICYRMSIGVLDHKELQQCCAGIPEALAASNGADIAVCALLMSTFAAFAFPSDQVAVRGLHLPISLAAGACAGLLAGALCSWSLIWRTAQQRAATMLLAGQALAFLGYASFIMALPSIFPAQFQNIFM